MTNSGTLTNSGTVASLSNTGTINNTGTVTGPIDNSGDLYVNDGSDIYTIDNTAPGNVIVGSQNVHISGINNGGVVDITGAGDGIATDGFTQSSTGTLRMSGTQLFTVNGPASFDGTLQVINQPTNFGRYKLISVDDPDFRLPNLDPLPGGQGYYLKWVGGKWIYLFVTPNDASTKASIASVANDMNTVNQKVIGNVAGMLGNDCAVPGLAGGCVSIGVGSSSMASGNLDTGSVTISKAIDPRVRIGISLGQSFSDVSSGGTSYKPDQPITGGFIGMTTPLANGASLDVMASAAGQSGTYTINRPVVMPVAESGTATTGVNTTAYQLKVTYSMPLDDKTVVSPYVAIRHSQLDVNGYTEMGPIFPLTALPSSSSSTDAIVGVGVSRKLTDKLTASVGVGITQNLANDPGTVKGTSEIFGLSSYEKSMSGGKATSASVGAGLSYEVAPGQRIGLSVGWQDKTMLKPESTTVGLTYSFSF